VFFFVFLQQAKTCFIFLTSIRFAATLEKKD